MKVVCLAVCLATAAVGAVQVSSPCTSRACARKFGPRHFAPVMGPREEAAQAYVDGVLSGVQASASQWTAAATEATGGVVGASPLAALEQAAREAGAAGDGTLAALTSAPSTLKDALASGNNAASMIPTLDLAPLTQLPVPPEVIQTFVQLGVPAELAPALPAAAVALLVTTTVFSDDGDASPYPAREYDPASAARFFRARPLEVVVRALELGGRSAGFGLGLLTDLIAGKLQANADMRALELAKLLTVLGPTLCAGRSRSRELWVAAQSKRPTFFAPLAVAASRWGSRRASGPTCSRRPTSAASRSCRIRFPPSRRSRRAHRPVVGFASSWVDVVRRAVGTSSNGTRG